jgi:carboxymethylenebutenolidase
MQDFVAPFDKSRDPALSRRGFAALTLGLGVAAAGAAVGAQVPVTESDVAIVTADGTCDAALFHPAGPGSWPGVVIFADALGLRPAFRDMGRRLAAEGYAVLVPNPFYRVRKAPVFQGPIDFTKPDDRAKIMPLMAALTPEIKARDGAAYVAFLDTLPQVKTKARIGVVGYCMGGPYTLLTAAGAPDRVGAGCSFHGGGLVTDQPDSPHRLAARIKASFYFGIAANDDQRQPDAKDKLRAAFAAAGRPAKIEVYDGANHGWCVSDGAAYDKPQAERAYGEMMALYGRALV